MSKPRYKCKCYGLSSVGPGKFIATIQRLENHKRLGPPKVNHSRFGDYHSFTHTSLVLSFDIQKKEMETLNSIYYWE